MAGTRRDGWTRAATIAVVAYALVLQALLGAVAGSAEAALAVWQAPGILCSEHGTAPGAPDGPGAAHHAMQCCILHGAGLEPIAPAPVATAVVSPRGPVAVGSVRPAPRGIPRPSHGVRPLGARAPPVPA